MDTLEKGRQSMSQRKIGAHVSAAGGLHLAVVKAAAIGCNCAQLFSGSPRVWSKKPLDQFNTIKLFSEMQKSNVSPIFTHALYLVNFASDKPELLRKSFDSIKYELEFDSLIRGAGVIVHVGSHQGRGWAAVKDQVCDQIAAVLRVTPDNSKFLIENSAGQKGKVGSPLEEIRYILDELEKMGKYVSTERVGWCFDTCHAFASGYHLAETKDSKQTIEQGSLLAVPAASALATIKQLDLWSTLTCIHVNDSRDPFASGRDRHANLDDGTIPTSEFKAFLNDKRLEKIPLVLEVPGIEKQGPDAENIKRLKQLVGESQS